MDGLPNEPIPDPHVPLNRGVTNRRPQIFLLLYVENGVQMDLPSTYYIKLVDFDFLEND